MAETPDAPAVLTINSGSSSLKFATFCRKTPPGRIVSGRVEGIGRPGSRWSVAGPDGATIESREADAADHESATQLLLGWLERSEDLGPVVAVGHRIVHGGGVRPAPLRIDAALIEELRTAVPLDPEHLPASIAIIETFGRLHPEIPQVACFDSTFHRDLPRVASIIPLPRRLEALGVRRYGFHGLSYTYLMRALERLDGPKVAGGRVVLAHLGSGASMAAVLGGRCVDTTMGMTPSAGLVMSNRAGDLDPGLVGYLGRVEGMTAESFDAMIHRESGLIGISETSPDFGELVARSHDDPRAEEAVAVFCDRSKKAIGAFAAVLGGLDALVFSGGIGEHSAEARARICGGLGFLGIRLDEARNAGNADLISTQDAPTKVRVIPTDEETIIAEEVTRLLSSD